MRKNNDNKTVIVTFISNPDALDEKSTYLPKGGARGEASDVEIHFCWSGHARETTGGRAARGFP
jgi:hypothetical protein